MAFIFAVHVPIAGLALLPLVLGLPILFGPIHIALLEMVIDPVCALVFEAERKETDIMKRRPRPPLEPLFSWRMIAWSVFQGGIAFALLVTTFLIATYQEMPAAEVRALTFFGLIASILALILVNRSFSTSLWQALGRGNTALRYVFAAVIAISALIMLVPQIQKLLRFGHLRGTDLGIAVALGVTVFVILEVLKPLAKRAILDGSAQHNVSAAPT